MVNFIDLNLNDDFLSNRVSIKKENKIRKIEEMIKTLLHMMLDVFGRCLASV